jgi:CHAD domain-containing protein
MGIPDRVLELFDRSSAAIERAVAAGPSIEVEAIHQLRVGSKRIRAIVQLVATIDPAFDPGQSERKVARLFSAAGALRDNDVQGALAASVAEECGTEISLTAQHLASRRREAGRSYRDAASRFDIDAHAKLRRRIETSLSRLEEETFDTLARATLARWLRALEQDERDLHEVRKRTKEAHALASILARAGGDRRTSGAAARLDRLQKLLGAWHDLVVAESLAKDDAYATEVTRRRVGMEPVIRRRLSALRRNPIRLEVDSKMR